MKFKDTAIWKDLIQNNELPSMEVNTTVSNETIWKLALAMMVVVIVSAFIFYIVRQK